MCVTVESRSNSLVKHLRKLGTSRSYRRDTRQFLCDGPKLLDEAHRAKVNIKQILIDKNCHEKLLNEFPWIAGENVTLAAPGILDSAAAVESPQGVLFSCEIPQYKPDEVKKIVLLDRLQDTGNLGTIIRTADAFGVDAVVAEDSADFWNPKTVRATMGALFRMPVFSAPLYKAIDGCRQAGLNVYAAMLDSTAKPPSKLDMSKCAVIIGNEGSGVRGEIAEYADSKVYIPMPGKAESLNAAIAASILMWEMNR